MRYGGRVRLGVATIVLPVLLGSSLWACVCGGLGGAQSSAESVARAYVDAIVAQDCARAESYLDPQVRGKMSVDCGPDAHEVLVSARIDDALSREIDLGMTGVTLVGEFVWETRMIGHTETRTDDVYSQIIAKRLDGSWYLVSW